MQYGDDRRFVAGDTGMSKWTLRGIVAATDNPTEVCDCDFLFRGG